MAVRIAMPAKEGKGAYASNGVRVYTDEGHEIQDIVAIDVRFRPDEIVTANIEVALHSDSDISKLLPLFEVKTLEELAESRGFKLVQNIPTEE